MIEENIKNNRKSQTIYGMRQITINCQVDIKTIQSTSTKDKNIILQWSGWRWKGIKGGQYQARKRNGHMGQYD